MDWNKVLPISKAGRIVFSIILIALYTVLSVFAGVGWYKVYKETNQFQLGFDYCINKLVMGEWERQDDKGNTRQFKLKKGDKN